MQTVIGLSDLLSRNCGRSIYKVPSIVAWRILRFDMFVLPCQVVYNWGTISVKISLTELLWYNHAVLAFSTTTHGRRIRRWHAWQSSEFMFKVIPGHRLLLQSKAHIWLAISESDVKSRDSVLSQDSLETHFGCPGLVDWCLGLGLDVVVLSISCLLYTSPSPRD